MSKITPIPVPKWGIEMAKGTLTSWLKNEGDEIAKGDEVFEMESDKATNVWEAPSGGIFPAQACRRGVKSMPLAPY